MNEGSAAAGSAEFMSALERFQAGDLQGAERALLDLARRQGERFDTLHLLGVVAARARQFPVAIERLERALAMHPGSALAHRHLAKAQEDVGRPDKAVDSYSRALELRPDWSDVLYRRAVTLRALGRVPEALRDTRELLARNAASAAAHGLQSALLLDAGDPRAALESADRALALDPALPGGAANRGIALYALGQWSAAVLSFDAALSAQPWEASCHSLRGLALEKLERPLEALDNLRRAATLKPDAADLRNNLGTLLSGLGRTDEALAEFGHAIKLAPQMSEPLVNRSALHRRQGRHEAALEDSRRAAALNPTSYDAHFGCGISYCELRRFDEAIIALDKALEICAGSAEAHTARGGALLAQRQFTPALEALDRAIALAPESAPAHSNRAATLGELSRADEALAAAELALALDPHLATAAVNRATTLLDLGRLDEALAYCDQLIGADPPAADPHRLLGGVLGSLGRHDEALAAYRQALKLAPGSPLAAYALGCATLQSGDLDSGWQLYERRLEPGGTVRIRPARAPRWTGDAALEGRSLLVQAEQGLGDSLQFCRYVPLARAAGAAVTFAVHDPLRALFKSLGPGIDIIGMADQPPLTDFHVPLLSMPAAFRTTLRNVPAAVPYLHAEPERIARWRERLGSHGFRIGVVWQGSRTRIDIGRSFAARHVACLAMLPEVRLISLQKGHGVEQLRSLPHGARIEDLGGELDAQGGAFLDTAAVMELCDLVISCDTAAAHLAGALARPTWVALQAAPDWRWMLDRADSPWYPTVRVFRQSKRGDWEGVFAAMHEALRCRLERP
jgi:tetratricopeptide (TPR) repeat protein